MDITLSYHLWCIFSYQIVLFHQLEWLWFSQIWAQWCVNMLRDLWLDFTTPAQTAVKGRTNSWPPFLDKKRKPFIGHSQASQAAVSCIQNHSIRKHIWVYLKIRRPQIDPRKDPFAFGNQCEFWGAPWSCLIVIVASDSVYLSTQYILFHIITCVPNTQHDLNIFSLLCILKTL